MTGSTYFVMAESMQGKFVRLLTTLANFKVDSIVVGGVAALLEGAPIVTFDLDVVYDHSPDNVERLVAALNSIHARYRDPAGRHIVPDVRKLSEFRMNLMLTDFGPFDALKEIGDGLGYHELLGRTNAFEIAGIIVRVLDLDTIIETKAYADRPKDRAALLVLEELKRLRDEE